MCNTVNNTVNSDIDHKTENNHPEVNKKRLSRQNWLLFFSLYSTQYMGLRFLTVALVIILRQGGTSLSQLSFLPLASLPIALKVLWAPWVDKYLKTTTGHYRNWLLIAQFLMIVTLVIAAFMDPVKDFSFILVIIFFFSFTSATQDLALSGLICTIFRADERYLISSVRSAGSMLGNVIGGGVVLLFYPYIEWIGCMFMLAGLLAFSWVQLWFFHEYHFGRNENSDQHYWQNMFLVWKGKLGWLALLIVLPFGISPAYNLLSPVLVDKGWSPEQLAILLKFFGSVVSIVIILFATRLLKKLTRKQSLFYSILFHAFCLLFLIPISLGHDNIFLVYFAFFLYSVSLPFV